MGPKSRNRIEADLNLANVQCLGELTKKVASEHLLGSNIFYDAPPDRVRVR